MYIKKFLTLLSLLVVGAGTFFVTSSLGIKINSSTQMAQVFSPCTLTITALPQPVSQTVLVGTNNFDFAHIRFSAPISCGITLNKIVVGINLGNINTPVSSVIHNLRAFNLATNAQVGVTVPLPNSVSIVGTNLGILIPAGGSVTLALKGDVVGVGTGTARFYESYTEAVKTGTSTQVGNGYQYYGQPMTISPNVSLSIIPPSGSSASNASIAGDGTLSITYALKAVGQDVYLDKDVLFNVPATTNGAQLVTLTEYDNTGTNGGMGNQVPFDARITSPIQLTSLTAGVNLLPGGTYKIPANQTAQFKISFKFNAPTTAVAPYHRWVKMVWNGFGFSVSDTNGNLRQVNPQGITWGPTGPIDLF